MNEWKKLTNRKVNSSLVAPKYCTKVKFSLVLSKRKMSAKGLFPFKDSSWFRGSVFPNCQYGNILSFMKKSNHFFSFCWGWGIVFVVPSLESNEKLQDFVRPHTCFLKLDSSVTSSITNMGWFSWRFTLLPPGPSVETKDRGPRIA